MNCELGKKVDGLRDKVLQMDLVLKQGHLFVVVTIKMIIVFYLKVVVNGNDHDHVTNILSQTIPTMSQAAPLAPVVPIAPLERGHPRIVPAEARIQSIPMIPDIPPTPPMTHGSLTTRITPAITANGISVHDVESRGQHAHGIQGVPSAPCPLSHLSRLRPLTHMTQQAIHSRTARDGDVYVLLTDATPLSLSSRTAGGIITKLIETNKTMHVKPMKVYICWCKTSEKNTAEDSTNNDLENFVYQMTNTLDDTNLKIY